MRFHKTSLPGVILIEPEAHHDQRGFFVRVLSAELFADAGIDHSRFVQENQSRSRQGTLRGLHLRAGPGEAKTLDANLTDPDGWGTASISRREVPHEPLQPDASGTWRSAA